MDAELKKILQKLKARQFAPVYLLDGEETYYMELMTDFFENNVLQPAEKDFNLTVYYGRDVQISDIITACRRYPMFAERQVVIVKDAAQVKDFIELAAYVQNPSPSTLLLLEHRAKKVDGRSKLIKYVKEKGVYYTADKIKDEHLPVWIQAYGQEVGFEIGDNEARLMAGNMGNDLVKIANEIAKIRINVPEEKVLSLQLIHKYIGISREYTAFELPDALTGGDREKLYKMLAYFFSNPRSAPIQLVIGIFYSHFSKLYQANYLLGRSDSEAATAMGTFPSRAKAYLRMAQQWNLQRVERCMLLISKYSAKSVGIESAIDDTELLKEFIAQMMT